MADNELPVLEHGRYRLWQTPDGGWLLARAMGTCERCQSCGCGEQQEHVTVPGMLVKMAEMAQNGHGPALGPIRAMRRLMAHGRRDDHGGSAETAESGDPAVGDLAGILAAGLPGQESSGEPGDGSEGTAATV